MIEKFLQGLKSGFRSEAGSVLSPNFETSPGKAMVDRSNIISQLRALGLSKERLADLELQREEGDDLFRQRSYLVRDAKSKRELAGAMLGTVAADIASDGMRNIWWFINAPQALTQVATQQAIASGAGAKNLSQPLIANRATRMAATLPAVIGMSMGIGQFGREPGFKATIPDPEDPTQTADPVGEFVNRYFLGRAGNILLTRNSSKSDLMSRLRSTGTTSATCSQIKGCSRQLMKECLVLKSPSWASRFRCRLHWPHQCWCYWCRYWGSTCS